MLRREKSSQINNLGFHLYKLEKEEQNTLKLHISWGKKIIEIKTEINKIKSRKQ